MGEDYKSKSLTTGGGPSAGDNQNSLTMGPGGLIES